MFLETLEKNECSVRLSKGLKMTYVYVKVKGRRQGGWLGQQYIGRERAVLFLVSRLTTIISLSYISLVIVTVTTNIP